MPRGARKGHGERSGTDGVLMAVEITSNDSDTDQRDRAEKPDGYAAADIPVHLLVDRDDHSVAVYSRPEDGRCRHAEKPPFGAAVRLPAPVDTAPLRDLADPAHRPSTARPPGLTGRGDLNHFRRGASGDGEGLTGARRSRPR
ncbi:Uma2 family endonuclease [Streptomyces glaucus]|uniref:Putative restriction endonuclease domain-containing protein n=1 Tax=Streptomyces glaucus TaxID=284029 RepID=A0ABP5XF28_9ACTN